MTDVRLEPQIQLQKPTLMQLTLQTLRWTLGPLHCSSELGEKGVFQEGWGLIHTWCELDPLWTSLEVGVKCQGAQVLFIQDAHAALREILRSQFGFLLGRVVRVTRPRAWFLHSVLKAVLTL